MLKDVYTVYDKKVSSYGNLVIASHVGEVTRSLERVLADAESALAKWPSEFQVVKLGVYDQAKGELIGCPVEVVIEVAALVRPRQGDSTPSPKLVRPRQGDSIPPLQAPFRNASDLKNSVDSDEGGAQ